MNVATSALAGVSSPAKKSWAGRSPERAENGVEGPEDTSARRGDPGDLLRDRGLLGVGHSVECPVERVADVDDDLICQAQVSERTAYQHFARKDELVAEYLRRFDPDFMAGVFDRADLTPRERLMAAFETPASTPLCPFVGAAVDLHDAEHPAAQIARDYKTMIAARLTIAAREAGAVDPEQLGEQLALLIDGTSSGTGRTTDWSSCRRPRHLVRSGATRLDAAPGKRLVAPSRSGRVPPWPR